MQCSSRSLCQWCLAVMCVSQPSHLSHTHIKATVSLIPCTPSCISQSVSQCISQSVRRWHCWTGGLLSRSSNQHAFYSVRHVVKQNACTAASCQPRALLAHMSPVVAEPVVAGWHAAQDMPTCIPNVLLLPTYLAQGRRTPGSPHRLHTFAAFVCTNLKYCSILEPPQR